MDDRTAIAYIVAVRLLLLLSALLSALSGMVGSRAEGRPPVAASAAEVTTAGAGSLAAKSAEARYALSPSQSLSAALPPALHLVAPVLSKPRLFAERRRE